jgi:OmcA/MtrC family decaheme c-type cytochrome
MRKLITLLAVLTLAAPLMFYGCSGDDGSTGAQGPPGPPGQDQTLVIAPESCNVCHATAGSDHQASYDALYQGGVVVVTNLAYEFVDDNTDVVTFNMKKAGVDLDCTKVTNLNIYFAPYDNTGRFQFDPPAERLSLKGELVAGAAGLCTSTNPSLDNVDLSTQTGVIVLYGYDGLAGTLPPSRVRQVNYPYAALLNIGTVDYVSAANVKGCEKCHTIPYLKHGNILGQVSDNAATDFYTCKACHLDNGEGGHQFWQELVNDPEMAAREWNNALTPEDIIQQQTIYAYKTRLMNDVHMSHAMEFEYPQSMANCATCHEAKLDLIFTDNNFVLETCKSCHPVTGSPEAEKTTPALADVLPASHFTGGVVSRPNCYQCHAGSFTAITGHTGYDKVIYATDNGVKYSSLITVTIDNASFDNNLLSFAFSATGTAGGLSANDILPTVLVGLYGYDTKDYLYGPHESESVGGVSYRLLEYNIVPPTSGTRNSTRITLTAGAAGHWNATADLSTWSDNIVSGAVKKVEIAVMPKLYDADNVVVALNAPSKTFDLNANAFAANYYEGTNAIVNVAAGCNNCHDALATTFHSPDRGGNIVVCRLCHITKAGASHLEMQSRSIDSYTHAIHTFQAFDIQNVNFDNAVQSMFYDLTIESHFPTFDTSNCVACHNAGKFNVPDQGKSLAGVLSASRYPLQGWVRNIGEVPMYVNGPAARACGACHKAERIKEDNATELSIVTNHWRVNGYQVETTSANSVNDFFTVVGIIMPNVDGGFLPQP